MDKLKYIKIKQEDGTYSEEVPVGVDASNVDMSDGRTLPETLGLIDVDANGTVKQQLDELNKNKVDKDSYSSKVSELEKNINQKVNQTDYNNKIIDLNNKNDLQDAQIAQMIANPGTATEGNSELLDIRIGFDGTQYNTAGDAVRNQISLINFFNNFKINILDTHKIENNTYYSNIIGESSCFDKKTSTVGNNTSGIYDCINNEILYCNSEVSFAIYLYDENKILRSYKTYALTGDNSVEIKCSVENYIINYFAIVGKITQDNIKIYRIPFEFELNDNYRDIFIKYAKLNGTYNPKEVMNELSLLEDIGNFHTFVKQINEENYSTLLPDLNTASLNKIYSIFACLSKIKNSPNNISSNSSGTLLTFNGLKSREENDNKSWTVQFLILNNYQYFYRSCWGGSWNGWQEVLTENSDFFTNFFRKNLILISTSNYETLLPDLNNAQDNVCYDILECAQEILNIPDNITAKSATLLTYRGHNHSNKSWCVQLYVPSGTTHSTYIRSCWEGSWNDWLKMLTENDIEQPDIPYSYEPYNLLKKYCVSTCVNKKEININENTKILAFGDSITQGGSSYGTTWLKYLSDITGCSYNNKAIGGGLFGHEAELRPERYWISTQIASVTLEEWQNANLIVIAAGTNDAGYNTTMENLKSYVTSAIQTIKEKTSSPILFITPIKRSGSDNSSVLLKLPEISGIIENVALINKCSVICGFDFPIPSYTMGEIDGLQVDSIHPNENGMYIYAMSVVNAVN